MYLLVVMLHGFGLILLTALLNFAILLSSYGVMRLFHVSVQQIVLFIGVLLLCTCGFFSVLMLTSTQVSGSFGTFALASDTLGVISFFVAIYAVGQWAVRGWYVTVKKSSRSGLVRGLRALLLFLRAHHRFFGWLVLATATTHALYFLPVMIGLPLSETLQKLSIVTGIVAWGLLVFLVGLGLWIENALERKRLARGVRVMHIAVALVFLGGFVVHFLFR